MFSTTSLDRNLSLLGALCRDRLRPDRDRVESVIDDPNWVNDCCYLGRIGALKNFMILKAGDTWPDEISKSLGTITQNQLPVRFEADQKTAFVAVVNTLRKMEKGPWPPAPKVLKRLLGFLDAIEKTTEPPTPPPVPKRRGCSFVLEIPEFARLLKDHPTSYEWTAEKVAGHFGCSKPTILVSELWKLVMQKRAEKKTDQTARVEPRPKTKADYNRQQMLDRKDNLLEKWAES